MGGGVGISTGLNVVFAPSSKLHTFDKDTNDLLRANCACNEGMVVSPLSNNKSGIYYTTRKDFGAELEKAKQIAEEIAAQKESGWFSRLSKGSSEGN